MDREIILLLLSNLIPLTPEELSPENNLNFSTGKRKHFPFDEDNNISSFIESLTPINSSL